MAMCQGCKDAATTGDMSLHCGEPGKPGRDCETCQHYPANDSRVIRAQKQLDGRGTPSVTADLSDSPVNHSHAGDTTTPGVRERQTF
jgi:hypothetical protein